MSDTVTFGRHLGRDDGTQLEATTVIDLSAERSESELLLQRHYISVPWLDLVTPTTAELREVALEVARRAQTGSVHVHCTLGRGRSTLVIAAWLLITGQVASPQAALARVKEVCPEAVFNDDIVEILYGL
jgi:protein-tyrosine phosphatase